MNKPDSSTNTSIPMVEHDISSAQSGVLLISILVVALCGIVYELIIAAVSSYLLGDSVYQFSLTIGCFMFAMGIGSMLSKLLDDQYVRNFIIIEILIALVGGICSTLLFMAFPFARPLYELAMYSLIFIIGALVGMEIPILTTLLSKKKDIKESIANVLTLDYLGALIGSVAFPLILLPSLGLVQSSFAIGLINIFIAIVNVVVFRKILNNFRFWLSCSLGIFFMLFAFIIYGNQIMRFAEKQLYFDQIVYTKQTPYQKLVMTRSTANREQRLYIDGHIQFSSKDEYRYHEYLVHPLMSLPGEVNNVLILGGGDGLAAREVLKYPQVKLIHLVDIDPEILRIAKELPVLKRLNESSLLDDKLTAYAADAFSFINQPGVIYDRVIIDMPDPHNEAINKLYSREFYKMIQRRLSKEGVIVSQSSSPFFTPQVYWSIEKTMHDVFSNTLSYKTALPSFGIWGFHLASNQDFPNSIEFEVETNSITEQSMQAATVFGKDLAKIDVPVNSIMEPKLFQLYQEDLKN